MSPQGIGEAFPFFVFLFFFFLAVLVALAMPPVTATLIACYLKLAGYLGYQFAEQHCKVCRHPRRWHTRNGCETCEQGCTVKYMDRDQFE